MAATLPQPMQVLRLGLTQVSAPRQTWQTL